MNDFYRVETMIAKSAESRWKVLAQSAGRLATMAAVAAAAGIILQASNAPARLVGVTAEGDALLIESTEPAAYSVSRPDPMTLVVDMRNVTVDDARNDVPRQGTIAGVRLEQTTAADGRALARVHVSLTRPSEYSIRSARNTIRLDLLPRAGAPPRTSATAPPKPTPAPAPT